VLGAAAVGATPQCVGRHTFEFWVRAATLAHLSRRALRRNTVVCHARRTGATKEGYFCEIVSPKVYLLKLFCVKVIFVEITHHAPAIKGG
jgi:hypothetical protein